MNLLADAIGFVADLFYVVGAWLNNLAVRAKMSHYADSHPSGGSK